MEESWLSTSGTTAWTYDSSAVAWDSNKQYQIRSRATDNAKNIEIPDSGITVKIDMIVPTSNINIPVNDTFLSQLDQISGTAEDNIKTGVTKVELIIKQIKNDIYWDGLKWTSTEFWLTASGTTKWVYDSSSVQWVSGQTYNISSRAVDLAGNIQTPGDSVEFMYDDEPPEAFIKINDGNEFTNSTDVTLTLDCFDAGSGISGMSFSDDNNSWTAWEPDENTKSFTLFIGDGTKYIYLKVKDYADNQNMASTSIVLDTKEPHDLKIVINEGDPFTNSNEVELALIAFDELSGINKLSFSADNEHWSGWTDIDSTLEDILSYSSNHSYTMPVGEGTKFIYFRAKDGAGNIALPVHASIALDSTPPEDLSITINDGDDTTDNLTVSLTLSAGDNLSGIDKMSFSTDGSTWSDWENYTSTVSYELSEGDGEKYIYFRVKDSAGNIAEPVKDTIKYSNPDQEVKKGDKGEQTSGFYIALLIIIIIIVVVIIFLFFYLKKKRKVEEPTETPTPALTPEKVFVPPAIPSKPSEGQLVSKPQAAPLPVQEPPKVQPSAVSPIPQVQPIPRMEPTVQKPKPVTPRLPPRHNDLKK
jgi:hypothetical protein